MNLKENEILQILTRKKKARNEELCQLLHCSASSLRRYLISLENQKLVKRVHGGVMLVSSANIEFSHLHRETTKINEKRKIAKIARDFIGPGMCLFLDSSSTVQCIIDELGEIPNLVVITNGIKTAARLSDCNNETLKIYITGGEVKINSCSVISHSHDTVAESFRFNVGFFSCRGIDQSGIYEASFSQANIKKEMMAKSAQKILLADDSKFDSTHFFKISEFADYDAIITNQELTEKYLNLFEQNEIDLLWPDETLVY